MKFIFLIRYLSVQEVAAYFSVSDTTVRRIIRSKGIPHIRVGRLIRVSYWDMQALVDAFDSAGG
ncbi:helix-turn-helix domain-containing protein [Amycolatopsis lurida]